MRLGVELSLYVVQSMFLLYDDTRTTLWFCYKLWRGARSVFCPNSFFAQKAYWCDSLCLLQIYQTQEWSISYIARPTLQNYKDIIVSLDILVRILRAAEVVFACDQDFTANGFRKEVI